MVAVEERALGCRAHDTLGTLETDPSHAPDACTLLAPLHARLGVCGAESGIIRVGVART